MHSPTRRRLVTAGAALSLVHALPARAQATSYPTRPIHIVVPYPAGGTTDQLARTIAQPLQDLLGQAVVIDNKPGASGALGTDFVARQPADGYTLLFGNSGPSATASLMRKLPYDIHKDFRPLSEVVSVPLILAVAADSPVHDGEGFRRLGARPGQPAQLRLDRHRRQLAPRRRVLQRAGRHEVPAHPVQRRRAAAGRVRGRADPDGVRHRARRRGDGAGEEDTATSRSPRRSAPTCCPVCRRSPRTCRASRPWSGSACWRRKPCPTTSRAKLSTAIASVVQRPEVRKFFSDRNVEPRGSSPQELARIIDAEIAQWGPIIRKANITI